MKPFRTRLYALLLAWGAAVAVAAALRLPERLPFPGVPLLVAGFSVALAWAALRGGGLSDVVRSFGTRPILVLHLGRFVGFTFLALAARGHLPPEFAQRAGWGDVAAAAGALALLALPAGSAFDRLLPAWNVLGLADLFVAVGTAGWLTVARPGSMLEIARFPLALIPLWAVPILIATHLELFRRMLSAPRTVASAG